jgi:hypothetical protein
MTAVLLWVGASALTLPGCGYRNAIGQLKGADFIHFYTLGRLVIANQVSILYDMTAQHQFQAVLVPESAPKFYVPVYPPQTALLFAPFAQLRYGTAAWLWALITTVLYAAMVYSAWHQGKDIFPDRLFVAAAAAAFPPFWSLVLHGQTTIVPLLAIFLTCKCLERGRRFLAGMAVGLLLIKPQFGIVLAAVIVFGGEWAMLAGVITAAAIQLGAVIWLMGAAVLSDYAVTVRRLPQLLPLLEPRAFQMHSLRALADMLPPKYGTGLWLIVSAFVIQRAVKIWTLPGAWTLKLGVIVLATVLVSPHLTVYDATVMVLPLLWLGTWVEQNPGARHALRHRFWPAVYWLYVTLLVPTALFLRVQFSVVVMLWMFLAVTTAALRVTRAGQASCPLAAGRTS